MRKSENFVWSEGRVAILKRLWPAGLTSGAIAEELGQGATSQGVRTKARQIGLPPRLRAAPSTPRKPRKARDTFWTPENLAAAKRLFVDEGKTAKATAVALGCSEGAVSSLAHRKCWKRDPEHVRANLALRPRRASTAGPRPEPSWRPTASSDGRRIYLVPQRDAPKRTVRAPRLSQRKRRYIAWFLEADWPASEVAELFDLSPDQVAA